MPEYLSPGVYIEEIPGPRSIEGVSTSTAGFLGQAERGPEWPVLLGSFIEYQNWFGGYNTIPATADLPAGADPQGFFSYLPYAVQGFFDNGGKRLYVARVAGAAAVTAVSADGAIGGLKFTAIGRGSWGNRIAVQVVDARVQAPTKKMFGLRIAYWSGGKPAGVTNVLSLPPGVPAPDAIEAYDDLVITAGVTNGVESVVNSASRLVRVWLAGATPTAPGKQDAVFLDNGTDGGKPEVLQFEGKLANIPITPTPPVSVKPDLIGFGTGLAALDAVTDISLYAAPDFFIGDGKGFTNELITHCQNLKDRFAIVTATNGVSPVTENVPDNIDTSFAAFYFPWVKVFDPLSNSQILLPPAGHVTGLFARTDIERGVHKAPANETLNNVLALEFPVTSTIQDILNPRGVNCIRDFSAYQRGIRVWGARTMSSDPEWKYVNVRRLFIFIEQSILKGTQWVVFEPNDDALWAQVRRTITGFLITVWKSGALLGLTQDQAFFVKCDRTTMTQDDIDNGRLICYIGIAPTKPAEFVIFRISQKTQEATA